MQYQWCIDGILKNIISLGNSELNHLRVYGRFRKK